MKGGFLLVVIGLLVLYVGVTGKFGCFAGAFSCLFLDSQTGQAGTSPTSGAIQPTSFSPGISLANFPSISLPQLPSFQTPPFV